MASTPSPSVRRRKPPAAPAPVPSEASPPDLRRGLFRRLSPLGRIVSASIAGISFVTGIIAVVPIFTNDATNFSSLRISAATFGGELEYGVPLNAPFDTFPVGDAGSCSPAQQDWLDAQGDKITTRYLVDLRNVASEGAMLALKSFRGTGEVSGEAPLIKIVCDPTGAAGPAVQAARLLVSDPAQVAYFHKSAFNQTAEGIPDSPVVWNLEPGETGQLVVALFPTESFSGRLNVTAYSGTEQRDFPILIDGEELLTIPGLISDGMTYFQVDGSLQCMRLEGGERVTCEFSDLVGG